MQSPFPGMDPFIEHIGVWEDFHLSLVSGIQDAIARQLPERYVIRARERSYIVLSKTNGAEEYRMQSDATITERPVGNLRGRSSIQDLRWIWRSFRFVVAIPGCFI